MQNAVIILLLILISYEVIYPKCFEFFNTVKIKSDIDGNEYPVLSFHSDSKQAANTIAEINIFTVSLIKKLKATYLNSKENSKQHKHGYIITERLMRRYRAGSLKENYPLSKDRTSYTRNKGEEISLCLRENSILHDLELLKFVVLHELAHIVSISTDHSDEFWINFKFLLEFCEKNKLYTAPNFEKNNARYCNIMITYNPIYDKEVYSYFK